MTEPSEPQWEFLPHDPERFFGLSGDFDLRDLKRSYNRLIRRFKPERFPDEFQRIRAAYESLHDALRYDVPTPGRIGGIVGLDLDPERQTPVEGPPVPAVQAGDAEYVESSPRPLHERLRSTSTSDLYADLQTRVTKTPNDYVALALLSDVVTRAGATRPKNESFAHWLLAGIADHPEDWGLIKLLREYLFKDCDLDEIEELLLNAVEILPPARFQYVTERAWDRLLREAPFHEFRDCLHRCGARLGKVLDHTQLVFYVHVLRIALWKADDDFLNELRASVEDRFHTLDQWVQEECEMVLALIDYRHQREDFIQLGPCCERIDQAIRDWCMLPETEGDLSVLECQYYLSMRGQRLLDEFPDYSEDFSHVLVPWDRIVADVLDRQDEPEPPDPKTLAPHTRAFMIRVLRRTKRTFRFYRGLALILAAIAVLLITVVTSGAFTVRLGWKLFAESRYLSSFLDALLAVGTLMGGCAASVLLYWKGGLSSRLPYRVVRPELIKLLRVVPLPPHQLAAIITEREDEKYGDDEKIDDTPVIAARMPSDAAIELFSLAQRCLHAADPELVLEAKCAER